MTSGISRQVILQLASPPALLGRIEGVGMAVWTTGPARALSVRRVCPEGRAALAGHIVSGG